MLDKPSVANKNWARVAAVAGGKRCAHCPGFLGWDASEQLDRWLPAPHCAKLLLCIACRVAGGPIEQPSPGLPPLQSPWLWHRGAPPTCLPPVLHLCTCWRTARGWGRLCGRHLSLVSLEARGRWQAWWCPRLQLSGH